MIAVAHADLIVADVPRALGFWVDLLGGAVADDAIVDGEVPAFYTGGRATRMRLVMIRLARFGAMIELMAFEPPQPTTARLTRLLAVPAAASAARSTNGAPRAAPAERRTG